MASSSKKVLSIEIGASSTRIVEVDFRKAKPHVYSCISFDTPDGAIEDGFIRNREILSVSMKEALNNAGIRNSSVVFSITSTKIANREVVIPDVADNKIQGLVNANAKDYFPIDVDQYVITHTILERTKGESGKNLRLLVLAAPTTLIESYYDFAKMMNFDIVAIDYSGNSCFNVIKNQVANSGTSMVVQLNEQTTLINIIRGGILILQRTVPYGTNTIVEAALNTGEFGITDRREAIEKLTTENIINAKLESGGIDETALSYMENNDDSYAHQLRELKAKEDITDTFSYIINNVIRVIDYYTAKFPDQKIDRVYLAGVGAKIKGIGTLFKNEIFLEVDTFDNIYGVEFLRQVMIENADKSSYIAAIGAAFAPVDFIPKEHLVIAKQKTQAKTAVLVLLASIVVSAILCGFSIITYGIAKTSKNSKQKDADNKAYIEKVYEEYNTMKADADNIQSMYVGTLNKNYFLINLLNEFEAKMPGDISMSQLTVDEDKVIMSLAVNGNSKDRAAYALLQYESMDCVGYTSTNGFALASVEGAGATTGETEGKTEGKTTQNTDIDASAQLLMDVTITFKKIDFSAAFAEVSANKSLDVAMNDALKASVAAFKENPTTVIEYPKDKQAALLAAAQELARAQGTVPASVAQ